MLTIPNWIEDIATTLVDTEAELHELMAHHQPAVRTALASERALATVTMTQGEAWILARCALPLPLRAPRLRKPHARLMAALQAAAGALLACNEPGRPVDRAAVAGVALLEALQGWLSVIRWTQACQRAHVRWSYDARGGDSITSLTRHQMRSRREQDENADPTIESMAKAAKRRAPDTWNRYSTRRDRQTDEALTARQVANLVSLSDRLSRLPDGGNEPEGAVAMKPARATTHKPKRLLTSTTPPPPPMIGHHRQPLQLVADGPRPLGLPSAPKRAATR